METLRRLLLLLFAPEKLPGKRAKGEWGGAPLKHEPLSRKGRADKYAELGHETPYIHNEMD